VRATVHPLPDPGHAILCVSDLDAPPEGLSLSIQRQQGPDSHLADDGWRRTEAWLVPARTRRNRDILEFDLGPEICDRLAGIATVRVRVREPDIGVVGSTVVAWPSMLTSGAAHGTPRDGDDVVQLRRAIKMPSEEKPKQTEPPPPAPPPRPQPELRAVRETTPEVRPLGTWLFYGALLVVIVAGGAYAYWHFTREEPRAVATAPPPQPAPTSTAATTPAKKSIREVVAEYTATNPTPEAMVTTAKAYAQAGDFEGAFLVWRRAAEAGNPEAQLELAAFYDPLTQPARGGFTPDGARAAEWYERAALAGLPEAQRKFGLLLAKGGAGLAPDRARARNWLQQAATQNDAEAKKALDALPK
jgi:hypothetical protein